MARTLLIGAYERENFGDRLFRHVTTALMEPESSVVASSPFLPQTLSATEFPIVRFAEHLLEHEADRVWVVGGEVGGTTLTRAYAMSASDPDFEEFNRVHDREKHAIVEAAAHTHWSNSAYMPYLPALSGIYVMNSVGLYGVGGLRGRELLAGVRALRRADFISVRERHSDRLLKALGVRHTLAPDVVHLLARCDLIGKPPTAPVALIQIREGTLVKMNPVSVATVLNEAVSLRGMEIRFFRAGSARSHDSLTLYSRIVEEMRIRDPGRPVSISHSDTSIEKAREIAGASIWIGTSLHGNVVSAAFGIPRVGLTTVKVDRYCASWREPMPYGVDLARLDEAAEFAFKGKTQSEADRYGDQMAHSAFLNFRRAESFKRV